MAAEGIEEITGAEYVAAMRDGLWRQGEHVAIIGPTGRGKTSLARTLLLARDYVAVFAVKRFDDTLNDFKRPRDGEPAYKVIKAWPPEHNEHRVILWTKPERLNETSKQASDIYDALQAIFSVGGWCTFFDDTSYMTGVLGLGKPITVFLNQGRSSGISAVIATTRPRKVPIEAFSQARHVIAFRFNDDYELDRVADIVGAGSRTMARLNDELGDHDFLAFHDGDVVLVRNTRKAR